MRCAQVLRAAAAAIVLMALLPAQRAMARERDACSGTTGSLEELAVARFGKLGRAERLLVRGAGARDLVWMGPGSDPDDSTNDAARGNTWRPERTIRAPLLAWLCTDREAARYVHPSGLGVAGARIEGKLDFSYLKLPRPLTLVRCYLPAGLDLSGATVQSIYLRRSVSGPIMADLANISSDIALLYGSYQSASFFRSHIDGDLDCTGGRFLDGGHGGVSAVGATILGDALFHDMFTTDGVVDFRLAKIRGSLSVNSARFAGTHGGGLNAERATVDGTLYWVNVSHTSGTELDLENARVASLWDDRKSWPSPGKLSVGGFVYSSISGGPADAASRLRWLGLQPGGFRPQPYRQLAMVLRETGDDAGYTDVQIAKEVARRSSGGLGAVERAWSLFLEVTIGYGYRPLRAIWWIIGFVALGTLLFGGGYYAGLITPSEEGAYHSFVTRGTAPPHCPPFNALVYSLENFLPVVELYQGAYWRPNPRRGLRAGSSSEAEYERASILASLLRCYLWLHILAGWVLTPLFFAGLSGLIRVE